MLNEINGYEIENWNVHNFPIGSKTTGKVDTTCVFCSASRKKKNDKCATIYLDTAWFTCNHCGETGQLHSYKRKNQEQTFLKPPVERSPVEWSDGMVSWFGSRKITPDTLKRLRIGYGKEWMPQTKREMNVVKFNYFLHGQLINIKYRDALKNFKLFKGAEKIMYNLDAITHTKTCVIVEGEMDVASFFEAGIEVATSVPNGFNLKGDLNLDYITTCYEFFENKDKIYLAVDNDEAGRKGQAELIRRFGAEKIWLIDFKDCKDANEYLIKYGKEALKQTLEDATQCPLEDVKTVKDIRKELREFYLKGHEQGYKINLPNFDPIFSCYLGTTIAVTGIPSSGKSDFVDQMCVGFNLMYGWKTAFASPENNPIKMHADKILRRTAGFTPKTEKQLDSTDWMAVEDHVDQNFFHIDFNDGYELDRTLKKIEELVKRKGIRVAVLDPFNKIRLKRSLNKNINDYTNDYLNELDMFARKHNILLIIVAHPRKMEKQSNGKRAEPDMYDIKGGGEWYDMMPNGLLVHRDYERNIVKVKVLKVKFSWLGQNQAECWFGWNVNNGRYTPVDTFIDDTVTEVNGIEWDHTNWITGNQPPHTGHTPETEEEEFEKTAALPVMSASQAFDIPDEVPDYGSYDDKDFEDDDDVPF
jgi:twinkle protein